MFRIFLIAAYISILDLTFIQLAAAQNKTPQSLEEINADLQAKKAELEPFDEKSVKVDVESLGLDDIDKNDKKIAAEKAAKENKKPEEPAKPAEQTVEQKPAEIPQPEPVKEEVKKAPEAVVAKPVEAEKPQPQPQPEKAVAVTKKPTEQYLNSQKKKNLKKRLAEEKRKKQNEKHRQEKLKKLAELREKYLIKIDENIEQNQNEEIFADSDEKIIPQKKEINRFISDEPPAMPILNPYRTADNLHIPLIPTPKEKIDLLFSAILSGNVAFFNGAYKNVENPNVRNQFGDTILTAATILQRYPIIASALQKGADPNIQNKLGYMPLDIAIELSDIKSIELLVDNGADIQYRDKFDRTYLMHAVRVGFLPAVELFVTRGLDVNAMDSDGFTPLAIAYRHKKEVIVKYLLKHGAQTWVEKPYDPGNQSLIRELENRWK